MTLPICVHIPDLPDPRTLVLPGGITIEHINLMQMVQPALTPLVPIFDIIDTVAAVFNCIQAIPDALGPPPNPTAIAQAIPELAEKIEKLMRLLPQLSVPLLVVGLIDLMLDTLIQTRTQLVHLVGQIEQIVSVEERARALGDGGLLQITICANENVEKEAANVGKSLASLGRLIGLTNLFLKLIGVQEIPSLENISGQPIESALLPLNNMISLLRNLRTAIPIP